jgi:PTS system ascorbate-specific IIA component
MSVGILLITHSKVGKALLDTAEASLRTLPLAVSCMPVALDANVAQITEQANHAAQALDTGDGVLVLTDAYGSTPANIAVALCQNQHNRIALAGINLPMLLRTLNYPKLPLEELADVALQGGQRGVIRCP